MACCTHAASTKTTSPFGTSSSPKPIRNQPPTLEHSDDGIEVRHANGAYFVRDDLGNALTLAATGNNWHQRRSPASIPPSARTALTEANALCLEGVRGYPLRLSSKQVPPEAFASVDSTALAGLVQQLGPEAFASLDTAALALIKKRVPEAFANPDTTLRQNTIDQSSPTRASQRGITKWEKDGQLWVALGPNARDHWDTLIRLTPTVLVAGKAALWRYKRQHGVCALGRRPTLG